MENRVITIGALGMAKIRYIAEFSRVMQDCGIRDPFDAELKEFKNRMESLPNGGFLIKEQTTPSSVTREEKNNWILNRDRYVADRIFQDFGYEELLKEAEYNQYLISLGDNITNYFLPCSGGDNQCHIDCQKRASCPLAADEL